MLNLHYFSSVLSFSIIRTLLEDNEIGWGVHGYKPYTPKPLILSQAKPKSESVLNKAVKLPDDPAEALKLVKEGITATLQRLNMDAQMLYNTMNKRKVKPSEGLSRDDIAKGLHKLTKFEITDDVLKDVFGKLDPEREDGGKRLNRRSRERKSSCAPAIDGLPHGDTHRVLPSKDIECGLLS